MDVEYWSSGIRFEWDRRKASANVRKHGVGFETACEVFFDPFIHWMDSEVVDGEERETVIGMTGGWELLVVVYVEQRDSIRLISARPAIRQERRAYEDQ
jgi:uncharacterized DUF497 family protein